MAKPNTRLNQMPINIKFTGIFDMNKLLRTISSWYSREYYNFAEKKHKYKVDKREIELHGDRKINEYVRLNIDVSLFAFDLKDVEVMKEGKKLKMQQARLMVEINGIVELDWQQKRFAGSKFLQNLQDWYHKNIIRQTITEEWEDSLYFKMQQLARLINAELEMEGSVLYG